MRSGRKGNRLLILNLLTGRCLSRHFWFVVMVSGQQSWMATGAVAVTKEDSMHPNTMQAIAAQRGVDLYRDATAVRRGRQARRSKSRQQAQSAVLAVPIPRRNLKTAAG
jgi:hypothetical protein